MRAEDVCEGTGLILALLNLVEQKSTDKRSLVEGLRVLVLLRHTKELKKMFSPPAVSASEIALKKGRIALGVLIKNNRLSPEYPDPLDVTRVEG